MEITFIKPHVLSSLGRSKLDRTDDRLFYGVLAPNGRSLQQHRA
jgi:hypothetical protein